MTTNNSEYIKLFEYVINNKYSRIEISKRLGISTTTVTKIIKEERIPSCRIIKKLCSEFNIPIQIMAEYFYGISISDTDEFLIKRNEFMDGIDVSKILQNLKSKGVTYTEISKKLGLTISLVSKYAKDDTAASCEVFRNLVKEFHIKPVFIKDQYQLNIHSDISKNKYGKCVRIIDELQTKYSHQDFYDIKYIEYTKIKK